MASERNYTFDINAVLAVGAVAQTAAGFAQAGGADGLWDLGGNQGVTITLPSIADSTTLTPQQARIDAVVVIDLTGGTFSGSTLYRLCLLGCNDPAFGSNVQLLNEMVLGNSSVLDWSNGITTPAPNTIGGSTYEMLFTNEQNGIKYQYVKLYVAGTITSITFKARGAVLPRE